MIVFHCCCCVCWHSLSAGRFLFKASCNNERMSGSMQRVDQRTRPRDTTFDSSDDDESVLSDDVEEDLNRLKKPQLVSKFQERGAKMRKIIMELENEKHTVAKLSTDLESMRESMEEMKKQLEEDTRRAGRATTTLTAVQTEAIPLSQPYPPTARNHLSRIIRNEVFKNHKVTNKLTLQSGELQRSCQAQLGPIFSTPHALLSHRESFVKLVTYELGQRRSAVNTALLKKWKGTLLHL